MCAYSVGGSETTTEHNLHDCLVFMCTQCFVYRAVACVGMYNRVGNYVPSKLGGLGACPPEKV